MEQKREEREITSISRFKKKKKQTNTQPNAGKDGVVELFFFCFFYISVICWVAEIIAK